MEVLYPRCAGLDVHKDVVVACVRCVSTPVRQEVRSFRTTTSGLLDLAEWLNSCGCTHIAMEATGVYWKPVWHILEEDFELVLANAAHIKNVPGRKTDVNDATWIADLLAHGLIRSSFVPPAAIQELRDLTRTRKQLVREMSQHSLRIQKILEDANLKLGSVLSDVLGRSGVAMLEAIIKGETDPEKLADLAQGNARKKRAELIEALRGRVTAHHRTMLKLHLDVMRKGAPWLKTTLVTAAWAAVRTKNSYLQAQFLRIKSRRGAKKAILAVAASMLTAVFFMLRDRVAYKDLGADHFSRHDKTKTIQRLLRRLSDLGCTVAMPQPA
jgi:transposase